MKRLSVQICKCAGWWLATLLGTLVLVFGTTFAGELYKDPAGGWAYIYHGEEAEAGEEDSGFTSLDGTWSHDNGSDQWDGSFIGDADGAPGGVLPLSDEFTYLRLEDTGDPRATFPDPGNRKLFFIHDIGEEGATDDVIDEGITLTFRARIPTDGPLDGATSGNGYVIHDAGKSSFTVSQIGADGTPATISFALTAEEEDQTDFTGGGLAMNSSSGGEISGDVDWQGSEGTPNLYGVDDPTQWNEFWVNIFRSPDDVGTHTVVVYSNGEVDDQEVYSVTAGTGRDYTGNYIALGLGSTPQSGALDVDFFGWAPGLLPPEKSGGIFQECDFDENGTCDLGDVDQLLYTGIASGDAKYDLDGSGTVDLADRDALLSEIGHPLGDFDGDGKVAASDLNVVGGNWQQTGITSYTDGDSNGDGAVNASDLNAVGSNWQVGAAPLAATAAVPEPTSGWLALVTFTLLGSLGRRMRLPG